MAEKKYIELQKALNVCEMHYQHCLEMHDWSGDTTADNIMRDIETIPTADVVEVKHGTWLKTAAYPHRIYCSLCCKTYVTNEDVIQGKKDWQHPTYCTEAEYCPHCGARMDGWRC